jgi:hypothetical protein
MKKLLPLFFLPVALIVCFLPCLARAQPSTSVEIKPPQLLTPENGSTVNGAPEFFWTSAVLPRGFRGKYSLKIVPVSQGQSAAAAFSSNSPVHQASMRRTQDAWPEGGPALKNGQTYAWCVQVVDADGNPVGENNGLSEVFTFTYKETETPPAAQGLTITTQPLVMTGIRPESITLTTLPLVMTGIRPESITLTTQPLVMTGIRPESITINTQPLQMTGMRFESIIIHTDALQMTGIRNEQPKPPVESDKTPAKSKIQEGLKNKLKLPSAKTGTDDGSRMKRKGSDDGEPATGRPPETKEAKQKLDLPSKDAGTVDGANPPQGQPDAMQIKQGGTGNALGDTAMSRILGKVPSMTTPDVPVKPDGGTGQSTLQQKIEAKKNAAGDAVKEIKTPSATDSPAGTGTPAGTGETLKGQKLQDVKESAAKKKDVKTTVETGGK